MKKKIRKIKPLNYINGRHMIEYIINNIPSDEIYIIYNIYLQNFNFEEIVKNLFRTKKIYFSVVEYLTRGIVETAYVGMSNFVFDVDVDVNNSESIVFLDNENIITINNFPIKLNENFISYSINNYNTNTNYSFISIENDIITKIEEEQKISDNYCCGMYGFKNVDIFNKYAKNVLFENLKTSNEFCFSKIYELMIKNMEKIIPVYIEKINPYINDFSHSGIIENSDFFNNKVKNNKYNFIEKKKI